MLRAMQAKEKMKTISAGTSLRNALEVNMKEGWCDNDYLVLFSEKECNQKTQQYKLVEYLSGCRVIGLKSWDDFIVKGSAGKMFTVPTVPMIDRYLQPYVLPVPLSLAMAERLHEKIKW
jgi:hypothetical protein